MRDSFPKVITGRLPNFYPLIMTRKAHWAKFAGVFFAARVTETLPHFYAEFMTCKSASTILRTPDE
jgi:hypothetical protein